MKNSNFSPILSDMTISEIYRYPLFRNADRENRWGTPVFFVPHDNIYDVSGTGMGGPKYQEFYNYNNSPSAYLGNCTWWCYGRLLDALGKRLENYMSPLNWEAYAWYNNYTGSKDTNANNIQAGDIICFDSGAGHVMFVEQVSGSTIYITHSAYSTNSLWSGYACKVNTFTKSEIYRGASVNIYRGYSSSSYQTVAGVIHTGGTQPTPGPELDISISPSVYNKTMLSSETYVDFPFDIVITGIPEGVTVSGGNSYPGLSRVYNTGWSYQDYIVSGETYRKASKSQTLRYTREYDYYYTTTKHMYFDFEEETGEIHTDTRMNITVAASSGNGKILFLNPVIGSIDIR